MLGARALAAGAVAIGEDAAATGIGALAIGKISQASADHTTAVGRLARARAPRATAVSQVSLANANFATALGAVSKATGVSATALGHSARGDGQGATAVGQASVASANFTTAVGAVSQATGRFATALGYSSLATAMRATAVGRLAQASADGASAFGASAGALHIDATAIGVGATTSRTNQMVFGTGANTYTAPGIISAAGDAAQTGQLFVVTSDAAGNLATSGTMAAGSVTEGAIAEDVVDAGALADGAVTAAKLGLANTAFVAADGATALDDCDALIDALADATGPAVVVLGPGTYDCGERQVVVPDGVELRGAGRKTTTITGALDDPGGFGGVVALGSDSALSRISVLHRGGKNAPIAVSVPAGSRGVEITDARLNGAIALDVGGEVLVRLSILEGGVGNKGTANIVHNQLAMTEATGAGAYRCLGAYDGSYSPLDSDCG